LTVPRIGCLAWGSLVWDPRTLPRAGAFRDDGPKLPVEFSRVALDGRVTLVVDPTAQAVPTYWVPLDVQSPAEAVEVLGVREKIASAMRSKWIGLQVVDDRSLDAGDVDLVVREMIAAWLVDQPLDAVVWTALPSRGPDGDLERPQFDRVLSHLKSLEGAARARAEEYIRRTPRLVRTHHRMCFEEILGWVPTDGGH
jgi:hypothetical protein